MVAQKYNKIFFAYFSPQQDKWLRKEAKRLDISISALIRMIVGKVMVISEEVRHEKVTK